MSSLTPKRTLCYMIRIDGYGNWCPPGLLFAIGKLSFYKHSTFGLKWVTLPGSASVDGPKVTPPDLLDQVLSSYVVVVLKKSLVPRDSPNSLLPPLRKEDVVILV